MSQKDKRFVIQEHTTGTDVHWDFMLELGGILQTYRLDKAPSEALHLAVNATKIFDHPLKFLTYQGPVNKGRGNVRIAESGTYKMVHQAHDRIELDLSGKILKGKFTLTHIEGDNWQFAPDSGNFKQP
jgi:bifunctional non-homologous end joining protein LigD